MTNALEKELLGYIRQLDDAEKKSVLEMLKTFLRGRDKGAEQVDIEQYNRELEEAEKEFENGAFTSHESVLGQIKKW